MRIRLSVVLLTAVTLVGHASAAHGLPQAGIGARTAELNSEAALLAASPPTDVVLAARFLLAEATKADALAKIGRLRGHRQRTINRLDALSDPTAQVAATRVEEQERLARLEAKLDAEWTRWKRSNRRAYRARLEASAPSAEAVPRNVVAHTISPTETSPTGAQWEELRQCEAGGDYEIVSSNGLYHGAYQFSLSTWESVGGSGSPAQASPAEQDERATILFQNRGAQPWPHCGRYLMT